MNQRTGQSNRNPRRRRPKRTMNQSESDTVPQHGTDAKQFQKSGSQRRASQQPIVKPLEYGLFSHPPKEPPEPVSWRSKRYQVIFFKTLEEALASLNVIEDVAKHCDQLNIVIKADADMDDKTLNRYGKVFAGDAWYLIHERRRDDGWYEEPR